MCVNRIFVQAGIYDEFAKKFTAAVAAMRMGVGSDDSVQLGPVINSAARERIGAMIDDAVSKVRVCHWLHGSAATDSLLTHLGAL